MKNNKIQNRIAFFLITFLALQSGLNAGQNFLWKVESENSTVYLLGSVHIAKESLYPLSNVIEDAYKSSEYLVVEMNSDSINPFEIIKISSYQDGNTLENNISKESFETLEKYFERHKIQKATFNKFKPWFAVMTLLSLELVSKGFNPQLGIDQHFLDQAKKEGKTVLELESFDMQMEMMEKGVSDYSEAFIQLSLGDLEKSADEVDKMLSFWKSGDEIGMEQMLNPKDTVEGHQAAMKFLLDDRNYKMTDKIRDWLKSGKTYFVVVGSAHLVGKVGIVNLLNEDKKYRIKKM